MVFLHRLYMNLLPLARARVSWMLVAILLAIHAGVELAGGYDAQFRWYDTFGLWADGVFSGKIWQLLTYGLLHGGWSHVGMNAACLLLVGGKLEWQIGGRRMLACALLGVIAGGAGHLLLGVTRDSLLVGFSGGCMALLLLLTTLSPGSRMFPLPISARSLGVGLLLSEFLLALMDPGLHLPGFSLLGKQLVAWGHHGWFEMGHACHFGGGVAGWLYGHWLLRPRVTLASLHRERLRREQLAEKGK